MRTGLCWCHTWCTIGGALVLVRCVALCLMLCVLVLMLIHFLYMPISAGRLLIVKTGRVLAR